MVKIIYFEGGEDIKRKTLQEINVKAFMDAGGTPIALIFPWTTEDDEKRERYLQIMITYFKDLGAREILVAMPNEADEEILRKVLSSDLIYLPGGSPRVFMEYCENKNIKEIFLLFDGVIIGNSAGAMVLGKDFAIIEDKNNPKPEIIEGLGLVDFSIEPHYTPAKDEKLEQISIGRRIYALKENSSMKLDKEAYNFEFFGEVYIFENGVKKRII